MTITIAIQCHNFQRRLCWMLSSLAQQTESLRLLVDVAHMRGNGKPSTEEVLALFSGKIHVRSSMWDDLGQFQKRGLTRNRQLKDCATEWLMFADCDMVYHPKYFERLLACLQEQHAGATYIISSGRTSNPKDLTNAMLDRETYPRVISDAFANADALPKRPMRNVGAGFCQIINPSKCPHGGYYVTEQECRDWDWSKRGSNPKSDMQFRRRISEKGGPRRALQHWFSENAIHLNHDRDPDAGRHLTHMR